MTTSRNIGLLSAIGDIIVFVDDDAFASDTWLAELLRPYDEPAVGAVGGRVLANGKMLQDWDPQRVGRLLPTGELYAGFDSDPGRLLGVDHVMGCNMSFRRAVLAELGGFREDYPGISGICEDSDMCLRVRNAGWQIVFNPAAVVDHLGASAGPRPAVRLAVQLLLRVKHPHPAGSQPRLVRRGHMEVFSFHAWW